MTAAAVRAMRTVLPSSPVETVNPSIRPIATVLPTSASSEAVIVMTAVIVFATRFATYAVTDTAAINPLPVCLVIAADMVTVAVSVRRNTRNATRLAVLVTVAVSRFAICRTMPADVTHDADICLPACRTMLGVTVTDAVRVLRNTFSAVKLAVPVTDADNVFVACLMMLAVDTTVTDRGFPVCLVIVADVLTVAVSTRRMTFNTVSDAVDVTVAVRVFATARDIVAVNDAVAVTAFAV